MEPAEKPAKQKQEEHTSALTTVEMRRPFLFEYITTLFSGLILLGLLTIVGYGLLDHWLGEPSFSFFSSYLYHFYLHVLVALVLFAALHVWMYARSERARQNEPTGPSHHSARVFLAVFLVILTITVVCNLVALGYVAKHTALGTANYSTKGLWLAILGPLQAGLWAGLLCWYFKEARNARSGKFYIVTVSIVALTAAILLFAFPIVAKRDTVIDDRTSHDLYSISASINEFVRSNNKLPPALNQIKLDDTLKARLSNYEYQETEGVPAPTGMPKDLGAVGHEPPDAIAKPQLSSFTYKLCAEFKTDTAKNNQVGPDAPLLANSSDFSHHKTGKQCFDKVAYGSVEGMSLYQQQAKEPLAFLELIRK